MALTHRWRQVVLIPCIALTAAALQQSVGLAESSTGRRMLKATLSESQKQQLFEARRSWMLSTYDQRLALLQSGQSCLKQAATPEAFRGCKQQQQQGRRQLREQGRRVMNAERRQLGLPVLPEPRHQKGRSLGNGLQES